MRSLITGLVLAGVIVGCNQPSEIVLEEANGPVTESPAAATSDAATADATAEAPGPVTLTAFKIGDAAPRFADLEGVDDKKHSLDDFKEAKAVVVVFTCNKCPVAVAYEDRLNAIQKDYADKGVQLVAINVNNAEADKLPAMKIRAQEKGFAFPYLYDPSQKSAREYGAKVTPHIYLLDGNRQLVYVGPVDDNHEEPQVTKKFLRDAIDAVLAGNSPETKDVEPAGCGIQYE